MLIKLGLRCTAFDNAPIFTIYCYQIDHFIQNNGKPSRFYVNIKSCTQKRKFFPVNICKSFFDKIPFQPPRFVRFFPLLPAPGAQENIPPAINAARIVRFVPPSKTPSG